MSGDELDDAIDAAVREVLSAGPRAGLRQRVLRQLGQPEQTSARRLWTAPRLGAAVFVVLVVIVIGLLATRRRDAGRTPEVSVAATAPRAIAAPERPTRAEPIGPAAARAIAARPASRAGGGAVERTVSATSIEEDGAVVVAPLEQLEPVEPAPLGARTVQLFEITIPPLQVEPMRLDPLSATPR